MRPQQQNRRMRGRNNNGGGGSNNNNNNNNNNRKGPNPLTRNYESNGPDVKIRGSAQQIAEKYATLARDAQSAGDRVMAENYLQHAEHYNRIIAAAQAQMPIQHVQQQNRDDIDDDADQDFDNVGNTVNAPQHDNGQQAGNQSPEPGMAVDTSSSDGSGPQPVIEGTPAEVALNTETATEPSGGRGRGRRPRRGERRPDEPAAEVAREAEVAAPAVAEEASAPVVDAVAEEEAAPAPRRGRRPRRAAEPAADAAGDAPSDGDPLLAAAN